MTKRSSLSLAAMIAASVLALNAPGAIAQTAETQRGTPGVDVDIGKNASNGGLPGVEMNVGKDGDQKNLPADTRQLGAGPDASSNANADAKADATADMPKDRAARKDRN